MSEETIQPQTPKPKGRLPQNPILRAGCIIALVLWFTLLLTPCLLIVLATQGQIVISTGSAPAQEVRLWSISEAEERGLGLSTTSVHQSDESNICVQTSVHFLLWTGKSDPLEYCDCYHRASANASWVQTTTNTGVCSG